MSFINIRDPKKRDDIVKAFLQTKKNIQQGQLSEKIGDLAQTESRQKMFEPVIKSNIDAAEQISKDLIPIQNELKQLNREITLANIPPQPALLPPETPQTSERRRSLPSIPTPVKFGKLPADNLRQALSNKSQHDPVLGIYSDNNQFKIGNAPVKIDGNDLVINNQEYEGTKGLWSLLTKKDPKDYTHDDLENYKQILYDSNALYQNNDPSTNKPKSSRSNKWALVKTFWENRPSNRQYDSNVLQPSKLQFTGKGIVYLPSDPVELMNRLNLLIAEFQAGNKTTQNEIVAISDTLFQKGLFDEQQYKTLNFYLFP